MAESISVVAWAGEGAGIDCIGVKGIFFGRGIVLKFYGSSSCISILLLKFIKLHLRLVHFMVMEVIPQKSCF